MKRFIGLLLIVIMLASVGCATKKEDSAQSDVKKEETKKETKTSDSTKSTNTDKAEEQKLSFPLKDPVTLSVFIRYGAEIEDFETNEYTKWLENKTNINFDFVTVSEAEEIEKLNLLLATGSYPELIFSYKMNYSQQALYGSQGILMPLNDLIEKHGENTKKVFEQYPMARSLATTADGNIYNLPLVNDCYHCKSAQKLWLYKPWLDEAGLEMPNTLEDYREVLKAFKARGNDVIPLLGATAGWKAQVYSFLMNSFVYYSHDQKGLYIDNGKVVASYVQDGWKEGLKYLQSLRKDGLLATESFTLDKAGLKQIGNNPDKVILGSFPYGYMQGVVSGSSDRWTDYVSIPPLEGPNGFRSTEYMPYRNDFSPGMSITNKCKNPDAAMLLGDLFYSQESTNRMMMGREGTEWKDVPGGTGINGKPALYEILIYDLAEMPNVKWGQIANSFRSEEIRLGSKVKDPSTDMEVILYNETKEKYVPYRPTLDKILPPLPFSDDETAELIPYETSIESYYKETIANFVLHDVDIDAEWDAYIKQLDQMGLNKMIEIYQKAYEANFVNNK